MKIKSGEELYQIMKAMETEKFRKFGSSFWLLLLGTGFVLPFLISLIIELVSGNFQWGAVLGLGIVFSITTWFFLISMLAWGTFTSFLTKSAYKRVDSLPYQFKSSFQGRNGRLLIDVEHGMIGFISTYNPFEIQIFNASRIGKAETIASTMTGVRFVFELDGKKITMYTLLSNRAVNLKSGIGVEAISKADTFVELLMAAKSRAEGGN
ncbi:MAG: hypothetical protein K2K20_10240 [Lachnospiraceae bacterium]|nr:hypothetical protein [Lachnospiraceae bacterium]